MGIFRRRKEGDGTQGAKLVGRHARVQVEETRRETHTYIDEQGQPHNVEVDRTTTTSGPLEVVQRAMQGTPPAVPPAGQTGQSGQPSWIAEATSRIMQSDTMHRLQAAAGSQIPPLVVALAGALSRLSEPQRHWIADDLVRDIQHVTMVCGEIGQNGTTGDPVRIIMAIDQMEYVAGRLVTYYEKCMRQLESSVPPLSTRPLTREEHDALNRLVNDMSKGDAEAFGTQQIALRASKIITSIKEILNYLQDKNSHGEPVTKIIIGADDLTYALGKLAALAESVYQALQDMYTELQKSPQSTLQRFFEASKQVLGIGSRPQQEKKPGEK